MTDRGQTEVVGYVLIFAVIVLTVALVTVGGEAGLRETRDTQQAANIEKGYAVLAENVDDVVRDGVPSRATELDLSGEQLSFGAPVTVRVAATDSTGTEVFNRSRTLRPLVYRADSGTSLVYANGAVVIRGKAGGVTMLHQPKMVLSSNATVIPIVNTSLNRRQLRDVAASVDSQSRVLVRADLRERQVLNATDDLSTLDVTITSPRAVAWQSYLEAEIDPGATNCTLTGTTVSCSYAPEQATVVTARIAISLE